MVLFGIPKPEIKEIEGLFIDAYPVGSLRTVFPAPENADNDWLYLTKDIKEFLKAIISVGFKLDSGSMVIETALDVPDVARQDQFFWSMKRGNLNLIVTDHRGFIKRFLAATHVARELNLQKKSDRILLFQAVLYANQWTE